MGMFTYVITISSKILPFCPFVDISLQDWSPLSADVVFNRDTFHSNLGTTDVFLLTPGASKWNKEWPKTAIRFTGYNKRVSITKNYFTHDSLRYMPIVLVTNIIITLNAINYFTKTFITNIWQDSNSASTFYKKKNITFNFPWTIHPCFFINILGV